MDAKVLSALIAGGVSLVVSLLTFWLAKHKLKSERQYQITRSQEQFIIV